MEQPETIETKKGFFFYIVKAFEVGAIVFGILFVVGLISGSLRKDPFEKYVQHERSSSDYDCSDFSSQSAAQLYFMENGGVENDIDNLDKDGNGVACESLF